MSEVKNAPEVNDEFTVFYCFNPAERKGMSTTYTIAGEGRVVLPDGTKKMDRGSRAYRASPDGILRIPNADPEAVVIIRKQVGSGLTEDIEVYREATLTPERKLAREKLHQAGKDLEIASLKEQLKAAGKKEK